MTSTIHTSDCREIMAGMLEKSVQCVVTSPPYWRLRDYSIEPSVWGVQDYQTCSDAEGREEYDPNYCSFATDNGLEVGLCECGVWRGCLGLEPTPDLFVAHIVEIFRAVRRVLRDDGVLWLNLGDSYIGNTPGARDAERWPKQSRNDHRVPKTTRIPGLKPKDLCCIPWRCAMALQADGWYLRSAMPWVKRNPMPESCTDRPASALEYMFLLTKEPRYYYDGDAVRVANAAGYESMPVNGPGIENDARKTPPDGGYIRKSPSRKYNATGRAFRNTDLYFQSLKPPYGMIHIGDEPVGLDVCPESFRAAHFATFARKLVVPLIKAGTSDKGCCPECGVPWVRVVEKDRQSTRPGVDSKVYVDPVGSPYKQHSGSIIGNRDPARHVTESRTVGWDAGCGCNLEDHDTIPEATSLDPVPCVVLDPFAGSGTVGVVANQLGRDFIGIEINPEYAEMARKRIENPDPKPKEPDIAGQQVMEFV